jgi:hypothetical protein
MVVGDPIVTAAFLSTLWLLPIPLAYIGYSLYDLQDPEGRPTITSEILPQYDFIVVGAGSAGIKFLQFTIRGQFHCLDFVCWFFQEL